MLSPPRALNPQTPQNHIHKITSDGPTLSNLGGKMHIYANAEFFSSQVQTSTSILSTVYIQNVERDGCTYPVSKQPNPFISPAFKFRISLSSFAQHHNFPHTLATMHHGYCVTCMCHFHELSTPKPLKLLTSPNKDGLTQ